jgi:hypothetical protein
MTSEHPGRGCYATRPATPAWAQRLEAVRGGEGAARFVETALAVVGVTDDDRGLVSPSSGEGNEMIPPRHLDPGPVHDRPRSRAVNPDDYDAAGPRPGEAGPRRKRVSNVDGFKLAAGGDGHSEPCASRSGIEPGRVAELLEIRANQDAQPCPWQAAEGGRMRDTCSRPARTVDRRPTTTMR